MNKRKIFFSILISILLLTLSLMSCIPPEYEENGKGTYNYTITLGSWQTGTLTATSDIIWYSFSGVSGTQYTVKWDDSYQGSGSYTADIKVSAYRANKSTSYFTNIDSGWTTPKTFTASATETIYIKVVPYSANSSYLGTFGLLVTGGSTPSQVATPTFSPAGGTYTSTQSVTISTTTSGASIRYTTDGSTPTSTSGAVYSGAISVSSTVTIKAIAYKSGMTDSSVASATYTINISNDIPLTLGTWKTGTLASTSDVLWYYFSGTSGTQYTIKWDDSYQGSGSYTGDVKVSAYRANKSTSYFTNVDSGWTSPKVITASATETIYIKVVPYSASSSYLGTFGLLASGGTAPSYNVSGTITDGANPISSVTVTVTGGTSVNTDTNGNYTITGLVNGTYTITPSKTGYTFNPTSLNVTVNGANQTGKNFTGTSSNPYGPPSGYYDSANGLTGTALKSALHNIIDNHTKLSYSNVWAGLKDTDEDPNNTNNVIMLYTMNSRPKSAQDDGTGADGNYLTGKWNREHTWAKSHGFPTESWPSYTDLHHLRPADVDLNTLRNNKDFDDSDNLVTGTQCYNDSNSFEPPDSIKGDVARMMFYMVVRYNGDTSNEPDLELVDYDSPDDGSPLFGIVSKLLLWHQQDPVSEWEQRRNHRIYTNWQHNRNPFIDHPEWVSSIWGN